MLRIVVALCAGSLWVNPLAAEPESISTVKDAYASWSPDGARIVFVSNRTGNWDIWSVDSDGRNPVQLTDNAADDHYPSWSPDGKTIAFVSNRETGDYDLFLMDADGKNQRRLNKDPGLDVHPLWRPDGRSLIFNSSRHDTDSESLDIYSIDVDGGGVRRLSSGPLNESMASYSADGATIVFEMQVPDSAHPQGRRVDIATIASSGGEPTFLTRHFGTDAYPVWHRQSGKIIFASSRTRAGAARFQLYAMDPDGGNVTRLIESSFSDARPAVSPDGRLIAFTRADRSSEEGAMTVELRELACNDLFCKIAENDEPIQD